MIENFVLIFLVFMILSLFSQKFVILGFLYIFLVFFSSFVEKLKTPTCIFAKHKEK